jgi:cation diffusion facilitator family transporter
LPAIYTSLPAAVNTPQKTHSSTAGRLALGARVALVGVAANVLLAAAKITAGVFGNSYALIADGLESTLDIFSSLVIWGGLKLAARPPDASHPYGHGKAEPMAAIVVALAVFGAAIALGVQSVHEILTPHSTPSWWTLLVLVGIMVIKELLFRRVLTINEHVDSSAVKTDAWHHRADAITSAAAFVGISIALIGGRGYEMADDVAALIACFIIAYNGWKLLMPALDEAMDVAPPDHLVAAIRKVAGAVPLVHQVDQCKVRKMGLDLFVDIHIEVDGDLTVRQGHEIAHRVKDAIRASNPAIVDALVHIEPAGE